LHILSDLAQGCLSPLAHALKALEHSLKHLYEALPPSEEKKYILAGSKTSTAGMMRGKSHREEIRMCQEMQAAEEHTEGARKNMRHKKVQPAPLGRKQQQTATIPLRSTHQRRLNLSSCQPDGDILPSSIMVLKGKALRLQTRKHRTSHQYSRIQKVEW
jgi:hypothetical protein